MVVIFYISVIMIIATWFLYPFALMQIKRLRGAEGNKYIDSPIDSVSVVIAAHNEEKIIFSRIRNILDQFESSQYNCDLVVVSDHSTDDTVKITQSFANNYPVRLLTSTGQRGKSGALNTGVSQSVGDVIIFSDAETVFEDGFIDAIADQFSDPKTGLVTGVLVWKDKNSSADATKNFSLYWKYELFLRKLESDLNLKAVSTGACSAVRRKLFKPIDPKCDQDFITPLDVLKSGYNCKQVDNAIAYDFVASTPKEEFKARVRMTSKNFLNTFTHWGVMGFIKYPYHSLGLLFHKLFRWLTPVFIIMCFISGSFLFFTQSLGLLGNFIYSLLVLVLLYGSLGAYFPRLPLAKALFMFGVVNIAFLFGLTRALSGHVPTSFDKVSR